jgi:hypothetical protein
MDLQEFAHDFFQNILEELNNYHGNAEEVFVDKMCHLLEENSVVENVQPSFWQKTGQGIKVNAYSYDEENQKLRLFVAVHEMPYDKVRTVSRTDVERALKKAVKFYEQCVARKLKAFIEESSAEAFDLAHLIETSADKLEHVEIILLTNCVYKSNDAVNVKVSGIIESTVQVWDIERIYQLINEMQSSESFVLNFDSDFGETFEMMRVPDTSGLEGSNSDFEVYVGYIPGTILAKAYEKFGQRLIERNVRSFLQTRGAVNKGIKETLEKEKDRFIAYNNGISTTAEGAILTHINQHSNLYQVQSLIGWQIVNGGQTTASLHHAWESGVDIGGVYTQAKLTLLKTSEETSVNSLIAHISKYANTQNKISFSDLGANDSMHIQLEQLSRSVWAPDPAGLKSEKKWYYERARGQYIVDMNRLGTRTAKEKFKRQNPKQQVISKTQLAKYYMAWQQVPHIVSKGSEANFTEFTQHMVKRKQQIDVDFFKLAVAKAIVFVATDDIVKRMDLPGYKANVVSYTIAMISHAAEEYFSLNDVWYKQAVSPAMSEMIRKTAEVAWRFISNPSTQGTNISQWCKREACWNEFIVKCSEEVKVIAQSMYQTTLVKESIAAETKTIYEAVVMDKTSDLIMLLEKASLEFIDKRSNKGCLWVIDTPRCIKIMRELGKLGYGFVFSSSGSKATKNRAAWFLENK